VNRPAAQPSPNRWKRRATIVAAAAALAMPAEGLYRKAYYDPPGILTACWGHTGKDVRANVTYSMDQCRAWLDADMGEAVDQVERCQPGLPAPVLIAFADAVFNMGPTIACNTAQSTAARMLVEARTRTGNYDFACRQLPRWDKARVGGVMVSLPGLTKRRAAEQTVCLTWKDAP
jgi:GH24 family phage-related lysozyme (muramidase)